MDQLIKNLRLYETVSFVYSLNQTKKILNSSNIEAQLIKITKSKIADDYIKDKERFTIYIFLFKEDRLYNFTKIEFNTFFTRIFGQSKFYKFQKYIDDIYTHKSLKPSEYKVKYYIFSKAKKKEQNKFNKLYQLIVDKYSEIDNKYKKEYLSNPMDFFLDSYDFFVKKIIFLFSLIILYALYYHKYELSLLGIPNEIISDIEIISILKLYVSVVLPILIVFGVFTILIMYLQSIASIKGHLYKSFKFLSSLLIYIGIFSLIYHFNFFNITKKSIKEDDFFLNQYFYENYYPRFAYKDKKLVLILGEKNKKYYYYNVNNLDINKSKICNTIYSHNFTRLIISILKNSKNIGTKKIISSENKGFYILNDKISIQGLEQLFCETSNKFVERNKE